MRWILLLVGLLSGCAPSPRELVACLRGLEASAQSARAKRAACPAAQLARADGCAQPRQCLARIEATARMCNAAVQSGQTAPAATYRTQARMCRTECTSTLALCEELKRAP